MGAAVGCLLRSNSASSSLSCMLAPSKQGPEDASQEGHTDDRCKDTDSDGTDFISEGSPRLQREQDAARNETEDANNSTDKRLLHWSASSAKLDLGDPGGRLNSGLWNIRGRSRTCDLLLRISTHTLVRTLESWHLQAPRGQWSSFCRRTAVGWLDRRICQAILTTVKGRIALSNVDCFK